MLIFLQISQLYYDTKDERQSEIEREREVLNTIYSLRLNTFYMNKYFTEKYSSIKEYYFNFPLIKSKSFNSLFKNEEQISLFTTVQHSIVSTASVFHTKIE